jgi:hypothetical protein
MTMFWLNNTVALGFRKIEGWPRNQIRVSSQPLRLPVLLAGLAGRS